MVSKNPIALALQKDLPEYAVESVVGTGATSIVYRATQRTLGRPVAIKRFAPGSQVPDSITQRFEREAAIWAHLSHENLLHLYDYRSTPNARYIVLEYLSGLELRSLLARSGGLPPRVAASIACQGLCALEYLHHYGIVHRDFKPGNLFLTNHGVLKLLDFGISVSPELSPLTEEGQVLGTPAYMSPEQARGDRIDPRSDLFSWGVVFFLKCSRDVFLFGRRTGRSFFES